MYLPLFFETDGLRCLVVGGGEVAARKIEMLSGLACSLTVVAPQIAEAVRTIVDRDLAVWVARKYRPGDCRGFQLVIAATEIRDVNRSVSEEAKALGIPVNVVDDPELCTVIFPAVWRDGSLMAAVSTGGAAPFMAAAVRDRLGSALAHMGEWVRMAGEFRAAVRREVDDPADRRRLYDRFAAAIRPGRPPDPAPGPDLAAWIPWLDRPAREDSGDTGD